MTGIREPAKSDQKTASFERLNFLKECRNESYEYFCSHFTPCQIHICATATKLYGWDFRKMARSSQEMTKN